MRGSGLVCTLLLIQSCARAVAVDCVPHDPPFAAFDVNIDRVSRMPRLLVVPAGAPVLVEVVEDGVDVNVEIEDGGQLTRSDNPLRRWVPQRALLSAAARRTLTITIAGKERSRGLARVRAFRIGAHEDRRCVSFWEHSAAADAQFSIGEQISAGKLDAKPGAAASAYEQAIREYAAAAQATITLRGTLWSTAELTLSAAQIIGAGAGQEASATARAAEQGFTAAHDAYGRDRARFFWARSQFILGRRAADRASQERLWEAAHATFVEVSDSHRRRGERYEAAFALMWASNTQGIAGHLPESLVEAQHALDLFAPLDEPVRKVQLQQLLAYAQLEMGRFQEALTTYADALRASDPGSEASVYLGVLENLAFAEYRLGRHDAALRHYSEALRSAERLQDDSRKSLALHGLGITYRAVGNPGAALDYLGRALELRTVETNALGRSATLRAIADVLRESGQPRAALARHEESLGIGAQSWMQLAHIRLEIARDHLDLGDVDIASNQVRALLDDEKLVEPSMRARVTMLRAQIALAQNRLDAAARDAIAMTDYFHSRQLVQGEFGGLILQAQIACARADRSAALAATGQAMRLAEEIRISSNNPTLRASLWVPLRPAFDLPIRILAGVEKCGRSSSDPLAALGIAEASRNRALDDSRWRVVAAAATGADARRRELYDRLAQRRAQIEAMSERQSTDQRLLEILRDEAVALMRDIDLAGGEIELPSFARGSAKSSWGAEFKAMPADTVAVEYWLGSQRALAWVVSHRAVRMFDLGPSSAVEAAARELHDSMRDWTRVPAAQRIARSRALAALIIAPLRSELDAARRLYFVADGTLHTIPFAALSSGTDAAPDFLVDAHDIAMLPSLRTVIAASAEHRFDPGPALIVADPVYTREDARFSSRNIDTAATSETLMADVSFRGASSWTRLRGSGREGADIAELLDGNVVDMLTGFDASRVNLLNRDLSRYRVLHFAAHAIADTEAPQLSALILSTIDPNGRPRPGEVFAGDLLAQHLDATLVVLSGCDTALGRASAGEGLLGLRYAAHASGARNVVASLWPVMDSAGSRLMRDMYVALSRDHLAPAAALGRAMRIGRRQWSDPALWASFDISIDAAR